MYLGLEFLEIKKKGWEGVGVVQWLEIEVPFRHMNTGVLCRYSGLSPTEERTSLSLDLPAPTPSD